MLPFSFVDLVSSLALAAIAVGGFYYGAASLLPSRLQAEVRPRESRSTSVVLSLVYLAGAVVAAFGLVLLVAGA